MRSHYWISAPYRAERDRLLTGLDLPPLLATVDAHRNLRGPYTAVGTLLRLIGPDALLLRPELAFRHRIEIQESTPELTALVPVVRRPLEQSAKGPGSVSRYPARLHSLRISHGLVDFLGAYLEALDDGPRGLVVRNVQHADATDREFLAVLLRRLPAERLTVVLLSDAEPLADPAGPLSASLPQALDAHAVHLVGGSATPAPAAEQAPADDAGTLRLARLLVAADGSDEDADRLAAYARLEPAQRAALHDLRAAEVALAAEAEPSLRLGALPYHLERGSDPGGAGVEALRWAQNRCKYLGFYQAAVEFGRRGLAIVDARQNPSEWWEFTRDTAVALAAAGRPEESAAVQDEARRTSADPVIHMKLAYETGMLYARHFPEAKRDPGQARAWVNQAIAIASLLEDPGERTFFSVFNRNGLALVETRTGRTDEALRLLDEGMERLDRELGLGERTWHRIGLQYNRAQVNGMSGRLEAALADYAVVIDADDDFSDHYFNRGNILRKLGRTEEAVADYEQALRLEPPFPEAHYNRGDARLELGDVPGALADFDRTLELEPEHVDAQLSRAVVLADLGDLPAALRGVDAGLAVEPDHARLLCLKGRLLAEEGALDQAREALAAALRSDPGLAEAWAVKAELAFEAGDRDTAAADYDRAVDLGDSPEIRFNRGVVLEAAGRFDEAAADFEAVLARMDDDDARERLDSCRRAAQRAHA